MSSRLGQNWPELGLLGFVNVDGPDDAPGLGENAQDLEGIEVPQQPLILVQFLKKEKLM